MWKRGNGVGEKRSGFFVNFFIRAFIGMAVIFFVNQFLDSKGIEEMVGLNGISFLTSGMLGLPGVALLYGVVLYQLL